MYRPPAERPTNYRLNTASPLYRSAFLGLGQHSGSTLYHDDSPSKNHGTLTGYSGSGDTPADRWQWDSYLRRMVLGFDGTNDYVPLPGSSGGVLNFAGATRITVALWFSAPSYTSLGSLFGKSDTTKGTWFMRQTWSGVGQTNAIEFSVNEQWARTGNNSITYPNWHALVGTYNGATVDLWLDGVRKAQTSHTSVIGTRSIWATIGGTSDAQRFGACKMADVIASGEVWPQDVIDQYSNSFNTDLRIGDTSLILPLRQFYPVAALSFRPVWAVQSRRLRGVA